MSWTKVWKKSLRNSPISSSHKPQGPSMGPRCPREEEGGRPYPDLAMNGAKHRGPAMSLCHVRLLSARASFLPLPSPLPPLQSVTRNGPEDPGVTEGETVHVWRQDRGIEARW